MSKRVYKMSPEEYYGSYSANMSPKKDNNYDNEMTVYPKDNGDKRRNSYPISPSMPMEDDKEDEEDRGEWGSKWEFILSCVGFSVGIGNVWRFPYLAYQNGGGAFILPYIILLVFIGKPMYYLETAIGQFSKTSPLHIWRCAPIAKGVGFSMITLSIIVCIYYNVIMAYSLIYMASSFRGITSQVPWANCSEWWGADDNCVVIADIKNNSFLQQKRCNYAGNITTNCTNFESSSTQFWEKYILNITDGLHDFGDIGTFKYDLPLALLFSWVIVFLCLMKGVKSSGKAVYFTATVPYVILIALLIRGVTLDGAVDGLIYLFVPKWEQLLRLETWRKAAEQMFFSLGISWGGLMMFGSYNKFNNKINVDAAIVSSLDFFTSLIASIVVFSVLGFLSKELGTEIENVAVGGQGLAFVVYPEALSRLPLPWLWSILFFAMLFLLGLDSEFALIETAITAVMDGSPYLRKHRIKVTLAACSACYLLSLPCVSSSGQYIFDLMDTYGAGFAVLWTGFWEVVGLMWIYGYTNVCRDIKLMLGSEPGIFWKVTWVGICPVVLFMLFMFGAIFWNNPLYNGIIPYPDWAHQIGWILFALSAIQIPIWAIIMTLYYLVKGDVTQVIKPTPQWGPGDKNVRKAILEEQSRMVNPGKYAYDNAALSYANYQM